MPALLRTAITGKITWLGTVARRADALASAPREVLELRFSGALGEDHAGLTRPSCSRVVSQYPRGTEIRNTRQLSVVAAEELAAVAAALGLGRLDPAWIGASVVIEGIPDFSHLPPSSRLQGENGATLTVDMQNRPCHLPAPVIEAARPGHGKGFKAAARGLRGVTAWVEREGSLRLGEAITLHIPDQRPWAPLAEHLSGA
ncbi:Putative metal-sulfur cluster biosynthesis proteins YuaD [Pseudoruegeria aquimaris]|uniref:Putative metal-sulfur cluster biosynthesis proteins YuaD n=1 Tax=Pseudoruegeria aquimaris TaxID=393663 RepID=A0A1Y5S8S4_9RHOB|nr:MOSC domain-containing protein [Pseudoruegeria aquimaris]SLN35082.1 Putative metal-sulfur cluster biosynthesis proteins YuaD [Pseudoruegeria aquimaris]